MVLNHMSCLHSRAEVIPSSDLAKGRKAAAGCPAPRSTQLHMGRKSNVPPVCIEKHRMGRASPCADVLQAQSCTRAWGPTLTSRSGPTEAAWA
jgi:hypothetical protein